MEADAIQGSTLGDSGRLGRGGRGWRVCRGLVLAGLAAAAGAAPDIPFTSAPFSSLGPGLPPPRLPFRSFGVEQGLTNSTVLAMAQDHEGLLWVGTENGLFRFDGHRFQHFTIKEGLPGLLVYAVTCGADGTLWVGTDRGLACRNQGRFQDASGEMGAVLVNGLAADTSGNVWVGTNSGLFTASREGGGRAVRGWSFGAVHAVLVDQGTVWCGSDRGLVERAPGGALKRWDRSRGIGEERIFALARDPRGRLWARSGGRIWMREGSAASFQDLSRLVPAGVASKGTSLFVDRRGRLWVPSMDRVTVFDGNEWSVCKPENGIPTPWIDLIFQDSEGSMWIGGVGLHQLLGHEAWTYYTTQAGLPSNTVWSILRDQRGTLWAGTNQGVARATPAGWKALGGTHELQAVSLLELPNGHLLAAGSPVALFEWDPRTLAVIRHPLPVRQGDNCQGIAVDWKGRLWICCRLSGLMVGEKTGASWHFHPVRLPESSSQQSYSDLSADTEGGIWVISQFSLYYMGPKGSRRYTTRDGVPPDSFLLGRFAAGEMFLSCRSTLGWIRFRQGKEGLEILERREGRDRRFPDQIYVASQDPRNQIWMGGGRGLEVIGRDSTRYFGAGDGLVYCDISSKALFPEANGDMWIGTAWGLAHHSGDPLASTVLAPPTKVLEASLGDGSVDLFAPGEVTVPHWENDFRVQFAGVSFENPQKLEVQTRLVGLETRWRISEGQVLDFPGLRPGRYQFEARTRYDGGPWGPTATLAFRVRPPWWLAWPALVVEALLACAGVGGFIRYRTFRLAARNRALEAHVAEATREIQQHERHLERQAQDLGRMNSELRALDAQKNQFLGIVAHDLRNPLGTISMAAEMLESEDDPEEVRRTAQMIREESLGMSVLVGRFLDSAAIEAGKVQAEPVDMSLGEAVRHMVLRHGEHAAHKDIQLLTLLSPDGDRIHADPRFVLQILDNLVSNALKFSPLHSCVTLRVEGMEGETVLSVEDEGPGLTPEDHGRLFNRYTLLSAKPTAGEKSTGLGLSIAKHMVDVQGGRIWAEREPERGAAFRVSFRRAKAPGQKSLNGDRA